MDYLDPEKKRKHTHRLLIGYGLMGVLIGLGTILLVLFAYGYTFDRSTRSIIQNGLVFVDTNPVTANVYINNELQGRGDQRLVLPAGDYSIEIREDGYRSWRKELSLSGGSVERLSYPFLFPEQVEESTYRRFAQSPQLFSTSPDRRRLLIQEANQREAFVLYDLEQAINLPTFFSLPVGVMNTEAEDSELVLVEWSNDNQHVILKHDFRGGEEFILLDVENVSQSQNLSDRFSDIPFTDISLVDKQFDNYHLFDRDTGGLIFAELGEDETELLLENVITYRSHGSDILLFAREIPAVTEATMQSEEAQESTASNEANNVGIYILDDGDVYQLDTLPEASATSYLLDIARFSNSWYAVVGYANQNSVVVYRDPITLLEENPGRTLRPIITLRTENAPESVSFSSNARNIALQAGNEFTVYDAEREEMHRFNLGEEDESTSRAQWMDGHRIVAIQQNHMRISDFDGENQQTIAGCLPGHRSLFDNTYEFAYCVAPSDNEDNYGVLRRLSLRAEDD